MEEHAGQREALPEFFERVGALRGARATTSSPSPGRSSATSSTGSTASAWRRTRSPATGRSRAAVAEREGYFPDGADVFVVHPPTGLHGLAPHEGGRWLFTVSRLDAPKRIDLLIRAMGLVRAKVELHVAGTGPAEAELRELAAGDRRITFHGRVAEETLAALYAGARAVAFVPHEEDFGLVTLEAMRAAKPVITATDSGGTAELVTHGVNGLVAEPTPEALAAAIDELWSDRRRAKRMGRAGLERSRAVTWDALVRELERWQHEPHASIGPQAGRAAKLVVATSFPVWPPRGGGQSRIFGLYSALARLGVAVDIVSLVRPQCPRRDAHDRARRARAARARLAGARHRRVPPARPDRRADDRPRAGAALGPHAPVRRGTGRGGRRGRGGGGLPPVRPAGAGCACAAGCR